MRSFAEEAGIRAMLVKDESTRFGEQAFKPLGGAYAMLRIICRELGLDYRLTTLDQLLRDQQHKEDISKMTLITTTDTTAVVSVGHPDCSEPRVMSICRREQYRSEQRTCAEPVMHIFEITNMLYDDCMKYTAKLARDNGWHLIHDKHDKIKNENMSIFDMSVH